MFPVFQGLGQLKWLWFTSKTPRPLFDFSDFDNASHGGVSSLKLLYPYKG